MKHFVLALFLGCLGSGELAHAQQETQQTEAYVAPQVVIEAERPAQTQPRKQETIQAEAGVGAKVLDAPVNELGIELKTLEGTEDLSIHRRNNVWRLKPELEKRNWVTQFKIDLSQDQRLKARLLGKLSKTDVEIEAGLARDRRDIRYWDNGGTFQDKRDDSVRSFQNKDEQHHVKLRAYQKEWTAILERDGRLSNVRASQRMLGEKQQSQWLGSSKLTVGQFEVLPYGQIQESEYEARALNQTSSSTDGIKGGAQLRAQWGGKVSTTLDGYHESLERTYFGGQNLSFSRSSLKGRARLENLKNRWLELSAHALSEVFEDKTALKTKKTDLIWDVGAELSSTKRIPIGVAARARRYAITPTAIQRFGDGALLKESLDLPSETGIRLETGPWWSTESVFISAHVFSEESQNSPVQVGTSPVEARTLPIEGVWARGAELKTEAYFEKMKWLGAVTYQIALNDSQINWQRGHDVPGRPALSAKSEAEYALGRVFFGTTYHYRSEEARDSVGLLRLPALHRAGAFVGYQKKTWDLRLVAKNLVLYPDATQPLQFEGTAGTNIIEPEFMQREVRLQLEVVL
ncbi:MAG: hypothetical protein AB1540_10310 [Bdellovibrionota bacterium]